MSTRLSQPGNVAMKDGHWLATKNTMDVIDEATPLVMSALDAMDIEDGQLPSVLTDMGCATRRQLIEEFYTAYGSMVECEPSRHSMDYVHAYLTIAKS